MQHDRQQQPAHSYEGRPLVRPGEEVVDQGLGFDLTTLFDRRQVLRVLGLGAAAVGLAACGADSGSGTTAGSSASSATAASGEIPDETAGPYPGDGSNGPDVLEQSGIVRSDIRSSFGDAGGTAQGVPMTLDLVITDLGGGGVPFEGVAVYVWHCSREGGYSLYSEGIESENYLRGVQVADSAGWTRFTSVFPGARDGLWPRLRFEVYSSLVTTGCPVARVTAGEITLPADACDKAYATPGYESSRGLLVHPGAPLAMACVTGDVRRGLVATRTLGI
jgi:hypothetical protein